MALTKIIGDVIASNTISSNNISSTVELGGPKIANVQIANSSWGVLDDTAVSVDGGYIIVNGSGFVSGCQVIVDGVTAPSVTFANSSQLRVTVSSDSAGTYMVYVVNPDGGTAIGVNALTYSATPTWVTDTTLTTAIANTEYSYQLEATGAVSYSLQAGSSLPANATLAANGLLVGTTSVESNTNYTFTVVATDNENQDSPRTFSLDINPVLAISADILIVAGGGGAAGTWESGPGGGGGVLAGTLILTADETYNVVVGAGGNTGQNDTNSDAANGYRGGNSSFSTHVAVGGGGGQWYQSGDTSRTSGGSGGGVARGITPGQALQSNSSPLIGYGHNGATGVEFASGGGGGAGSPGSAATSATSGGDGGAGYQWVDGNYYGGGGGGAGNSTGGTGGVGGGGNGAAEGADAANGAPNTGGGGGGKRTQTNLGGTGGSGVVIIRYVDTYANAVSTTGSPTFTSTGGYKTYTFTSNGSITF